MVIQAPPAPPEPKPDIDAGVIEDARRRQRTHRLVGVLATVAAAVIGLVVGFGGGSGGNDHIGGQGPSPKAPGSGGAAVLANSEFPGAPVSQNDADGVSSWECPLAPASRFLPTRSGCVTAIRADMTGDGRADLVIVYSHLNHTSGYYPGGPTKWRHYFGASDATVEIVLPNGERISTRLAASNAGHSYPVHAAAVIAVKHVNNEPGDELFLQISEISSGSTAMAYGLDHGRLVPAGALLAYGADSGVQAGFSCNTTTQPPEVVQRTFVLGARGFAARWKETKLTYAWHGPKLVKIRSQTIAGSRNRPSSQLGPGSGCGPTKPSTRGNAA